MAITEDDLWKTVFKRLVPWTMKRHSMNSADAEETVQEAIRLFLTAGGHADTNDPPSLLRALGSQINGIAINRQRKKARLNVQLTEDGSTDLSPDCSTTQECRVITKQIAARAVSTLLDRVAGDNLATAIVMEMSEENDIPAEQAKDIGCDVAQVYNGRRRLKGHVDAVGKLMEEW
jgi:DNA-binding FrmR family transcriptional regulator